MEFLFKDTSFKFETLRAAGFAVDNGAVAMTKRVIALRERPVILVGHSWGGAVITQTLPTFHLAMLEQPEKVAEVIEDAAVGAIKR